MTCPSCGSDAWPSTCPNLYHAPGKVRAPLPPACDCETCDPDGDLSYDGGALLCRVIDRPWTMRSYTLKPSGGPDGR